MISSCASRRDERAEENCGEHRRFRDDAHDPLLFLRGADGFATARAVPDHGPALFRAEVDSTRFLTCGRMACGAGTSATDADRWRLRVLAAGAGRTRRARRDIAPDITVRLRTPRWQVLRTCSIAETGTILSGDADLIATPGLGAIERGIGGAEQRFADIHVTGRRVSGCRIRIEWRAGGADTDRQRPRRKRPTREHRGRFVDGAAQIIREPLRLERRALRDSRCTNSSPP